MRVVFLSVVCLAVIMGGCGGATDGAVETTTAPDLTTAPETTIAPQTAVPPDSTAASDITAGTSGTTNGDSTMSRTTTVSIKTSMGDITAELDAARAPLTVANFLSYIKDGTYAGTIFHRVMPGFMIQGGGFTPDMKQKATHPPVKNEATNGLKNLRGTLAMARTNVVDSATSQFFINVVDNAFLDFKSDTAQGYGYAVFGKVTVGMDVVDAIVATPTTTKESYENVPVAPVVIESITVVE